MHTHAVELILFGAISLAVIYFLVRVDFISYLIDYSAQESGIYFFLFTRIKFYCLTYENIEEAGEARFGGAFQFSAYNLKNRFYATTFYVKKRRGFFVRNILLTPRNGNDFRSHLERAGITVTN